jgi:NADPH2:quinone reductase
MRALLCRAYGPPDALTLAEIEAPEPRAGEVLVRVRACGLNFFDLLMLENKYQFHPDLPFAPGAEIAGEVIAAGTGVHSPRAGERVMALCGARGLQEQTTVPSAQCLVIPPSLDDVTAAAFQVTYGTAYHALVDRAQLRAGETLLVLGATGGVGSAALDIGRHLGARVIAAGTNPTKLARVRELYGVEHCIELGDPALALKDEVNRLTGGGGADVIFDPIGGEAFQQCLRCIAWNGRILVIGFAADNDNLPRAPTNLLLLKGAALMGVFLGRMTKEEPQRYSANFRTLFELHAAGRLAPHVSHVFPLARGIEALQTLARREVLGKCVVTI